MVYKHKHGEREGEDKLLWIPSEIVLSNRILTIGLGKESGKWVLWNCRIPTQQRQNWIDVPFKFEEIVDWLSQSLQN